jgi:hypothetical protein
LIIILARHWLKRRLARDCQLDNRFKITENLAAIDSNLACSSLFTVEMVVPLSIFAEVNAGLKYNAATLPSA